MAEQQHHAGGTDKSDVDVKVIVWSIVIFAIFTVVSFGFVYWSYGALRAYEDSQQQESMSKLGNQPQELPAEVKVTVDNPVVTALPPTPRLQPDPPKDLKAMQAEQDAALNSYGWVDREKGVVHVPIDKAMAMAIEKSLVRSQSAAAMPAPAAIAPAPVAAR